VHCYVTAVCVMCACVQALKRRIQSKIALIEREVMSGEPVELRPSCDREVRGVNVCVMMMTI
jgi:hypothetical protein